MQKTNAITDYVLPAGILVYPVLVWPVTTWSTGSVGIVMSAFSMISCVLIGFARRLRKNLDQVQQKESVPVPGQSTNQLYQQQQIQAPPFPQNQKRHWQQ